MLMQKETETTKKTHSNIVIIIILTYCKKSIAQDKNKDILKSHHASQTLLYKKQLQFKKTIEIGPSSKIKDKLFLYLAIIYTGY